MVARKSDVELTLADLAAHSGRDYWLSMSSEGRFMWTGDDGSTQLGSVLAQVDQGYRTMVCGIEGLPRNWKDEDYRHPQNILVCAYFADTDIAWAAAIYTELLHHPSLEIRRGQTRFGYVEWDELAQDGLLLARGACARP